MAVKLCWTTWQVLVVSISAEGEGSIVYTCFTLYTGWRRKNVTFLKWVVVGRVSFHRYKIMIVQKLLPSNFVQRILFCERMLEIIASDDVILMMSDEAHFHLDGYVNKQNCRFWAAENPRELHQRPLHTVKVSVRCGI